MNAPLIAAPADEALVNAAFENNTVKLLALLDEGVEVNQRDEYGSTALHWAAQHGSVEMVKVLLSRGADVHLKDKAGEDAIYLAADNGNAEIVQLLTEAMNLQKA
jgi:ankyrin repeat protein